MKNLPYLDKRPPTPCCDNLGSPQDPRLIEIAGDPILKRLSKISSGSADTVREILQTLALHNSSSRTFQSKDRSVRQARLGLDQNGTPTMDLRTRTTIPSHWESVFNSTNQPDTRLQHILKTILYGGKAEGLKTAVITSESWLVIREAILRKRFSDEIAKCLGWQAGTRQELQKWAVGIDDPERDISQTSAMIYRNSALWLHGPTPGNPIASLEAFLEHFARKITEESL